MSEVYIRSQNKEKLYRLGGNYACVEYGEYEDIKKKRGGAEADKKRHVICISDGCLEEIGEYATKERCLEVLDEIQKACVSYLFTAGGAAIVRGGMDVQPFAAVIPRLYEIERRREAAGRGVEYKAFEMYFMQGMDYAEIAEQLDTGKNTPRRWVTGIINELSVLLWGIDEERVK